MAKSKRYWEAVNDGRKLYYQCTGERLTGEVSEAVDAITRYLCAIEEIAKAIRAAEEEAVMDGNKTHIILAVWQVREIARRVAALDPSLLLDAIKLSWPVAHLGPDAITAMCAGHYGDYMQMLAHAGMGF